MKIPKQFIVFLIIVEAILIGAHLALYKSLIFFFPFLARHHSATLVVLLILSVSFLAVTILSFKTENKPAKWLYIAAAVWLPCWFYLLLASAVSSIIYLAIPGADISKIASVIFGLVIIIIIYGIINARSIRVTKISVFIANLSEFWQGKTAVLASDLHIGHILGKAYAKKIIELINSLQPEIVFIPGDFFDGIHSDFAGLVADFKNLQPPLGAFFCSGNHELYAGLAECEAALRDIGITVLENRKVDIQNLQICGLSYAMGQSDADVNKLLEQMNIDRNLPSILLKHVPDRLPLMAKHGIALQLSGHTHHGQVWPIRYFTSRIFKGYDYGLKKFDDMMVYVSSGVGTWGPPVRIFTKSEIVQITFLGKTTEK